MGTVILVTDGWWSAERAVATGGRLARRLDWRLVIVVPVDGADRHADAVDLGRAVGELTLPTGATVLRSRPGPGLLEIARRHQDAALCLPSHGRSGVGHAVLGSASEETIAAATCPVFAIGPSVRSAWADATRIGWCIDAATDLVRQAPFCARWAAVLGAAVDILTVVAEDGRPASRFHAASDAQLETAAALLRDDGVDATPHVLQELQPARRIARFAHGRDLAVLIADKRSGTGAARNLLGSTTMNLVHRSPCPVLIPPGTRQRPDRAASATAQTPPGVGLNAGPGGSAGRRTSTGRRGST